MGWNTKYDQRNLMTARTPIVERQVSLRITHWMYDEL